MDTGILAEFVRSAESVKSRLHDSVATGGQRSRPQEAELMFGSLAETSFSTP